MKRNFNDWISKFKSSISDYGYYVDFNKIYENVDKIKIELNILNSLIGSKDIENEFKKIVFRYPDTLECIPILLAVRSSEIFIKDNNSEYLFNFKDMVYSIDDYVRFMRETGLFDLMENHIINNLYDYVLGVEVGLDSNGRKKRDRHLMEDLVEEYIVLAGFVKNQSYFKEMYLNEIESKWGLDLSNISADNTSTKRFDFVININKQIYLIETNFYASGGSKLNEVARSYKMLAKEIEEIDGVTFIWITDGQGWDNAKNNLEETFNELDTIYSINDLENGVLNNLGKMEVF